MDSKACRADIEAKPVGSLPSLTGAGKSPARTQRHSDVRDRPINAKTAGVLKICRRGITGSAWWYVGNRLSAQRPAGRSFRRWTR